MNKFNNVHLP